jgi:hypothetical protein
LSIESVRDKNDKKIATVVKYFNIIMAIFYLTAAAILLFMGELFSLDSNTRYIIGAIFGIYGFFRFYRIIKTQQ